MTDEQKTRQILALLKLRHGAPEWAHFVELPNSTGSASRRIDLYAINLWHSKRFLKVAYEIKVSRADFARELSQPLKRDFAEAVADECYFAAPAGLVGVDEVPAGWGLIVLRTGGLKVLKHAMQRKVDALPLSFIAALARRLSDPAPELPGCIWLLAGCEVGPKELMQAAQAELAAHVDKQRRQAVEEYKKLDHEYQVLTAIRNLIRQKIGYQAVMNPDVFKEWLDRMGSDNPAPVNGDVARKLKELHRLSGEILAAYGK